MSPIPKQVSRQANIVETRSGNSWAMIEKLAVRKQALPMASMERTTKLMAMNDVLSGIVSWKYQNNQTSGTVTKNETL